MIRYFGLLIAVLSICVGAEDWVKEPYERSRGSRVLCMVLAAVAFVLLTVGCS